MHFSDTARLILSAMYQGYFADEAMDLTKFCAEHGLDATDTDHLMDLLVQDGWVVPAWARHYSLNPSMILRLEAEPFLNQKMLDTNTQIRNEALLHLTEAFERHGLSEECHFGDIVAARGLQRELLISNLELLAQWGHISYGSMGCFTIEANGRRHVEKVRRMKALLEKHRVILGLAPQPRGRALNGLMEELIALDGWNTESSVRATNEENDVVISKGREYYLMECKWEKAPIEAIVVDIHFARVGKRSECGGLILSMSGFSRGAVESAREHMNSRRILLFGPTDFEKLLHRTSSFDEMLSCKCDELIKHKNIIWQ